MRSFLVYLQLELKRTIKGIPYVIAGAVVLALLAGTIAFSAGKMLYGEQSVGTIAVGVALPKEDPMAEKAMQMIASLDSVDSLCDFVYLEEEEAKKQLKEGKLFALMKLPDGLIQGIMDGSNVPVVVVFPEGAGPESAVFRELTEAGSKILTTAQAGIYGADEYLYTNGQAYLVPNAEEDLNRVFLSYALSRDVYFRNETVSATGEISAVLYFLISAAVFVLLLLGIPAAPVMRPHSKGFQRMLALKGTAEGFQVLARLFCLTLLLLFITLLPLGYCFVNDYLELSGSLFLIWAACCLAAAAWIQMIYELCRNSAAAILLQLITAVVMIFMAGGIIPSVFLPEQVQTAGRWMPASRLIEAVRQMVIGGTEWADLMRVTAPLLLLAAVCYLVSAAAGRRD